MLRLGFAILVEECGRMMLVLEWVMLRLYFPLCILFDLAGMIRHRHIDTLALEQYMLA